VLHILFNFFLTKFCQKGEDFGQPQELKKIYVGGGGEGQTKKVFQRAMIPKIT
jgi:hypothetical protein